MLWYPPFSDLSYTIISTRGMLYKVCFTKDCFCKSSQEKCKCGKFWDYSHNPGSIVHGPCTNKKHEMYFLYPIKRLRRCGFQGQIESLNLSGLLSQCFKSTVCNDESKTTSHNYRHLSEKSQNAKTNSQLLYLSA